MMFTKAQQASEPPYVQRYSPDSLQQWTRDLMTEVSKGHPGFYRYTSPARFDQRIDSTIQTIQDSLTSLEFYRKLKPLFAQIGCLHTSLNLSESYQTQLEKTGDLIPLEVFVDAQMDAYVSKKYASHSDLPIAGKILAINEVPIGDILSKLYAAIPSDGYNTSLKRLLLSLEFAQWYQIIINLQGPFSVKVEHQDQISSYLLDGVSSEAFPAEEWLYSNVPQLSLEVKEEEALLTIRTFAKTEIKKNGQKFTSFIRQTFQQLEEANISRLIIDLRYNTGGTDGNAAFLASYFFDKPFRYWEKVEVTELIASQIKGYHRLFFPKPVKVDSHYLWKGAHFTKEFDYYKLQQVAKQPFKGTVFLLTNGLCMSSCSDFVAILSHNEKATVVGEESGGGYQGNSSGMMPTYPIHPHMEMTLPLQKYTNAVDLDKYPGRGTIPDIKLPPTVHDWINGPDSQLESAIKLIREVNQ